MTDKPRLHNFDHQVEQLMQLAIAEDEGVKALKARIKLLTETLQRASDHLDYCGYGDNWERQCSGTLEADIAEVLS
jgi:hypothetical protein